MTKLGLWDSKVQLHKVIMSINAVVPKDIRICLYEEKRRNKVNVNK
jgi:hypothetical protein